MTLENTALPMVQVLPLESSKNPIPVLKRSMKND